MVSGMIYTSFIPLSEERMFWSPWESSLMSKNRQGNITLLIVFKVLSINHGPVWFADSKSGALLQQFSLVASKSGPLFYDNNVKGFLSVHFNFPCQLHETAGQAVTQDAGWTVSIHRQYFVLHSFTPGGCIEVEKDKPSKLSYYKGNNVLQTIKIPGEQITFEVWMSI